MTGVDMDVDAVVLFVVVVIEMFLYSLTCLLRLVVVKRTERQERTQGTNRDPQGEHM